MAADSIGIETVNGKVYILHKVSPGQTMFAVTRRYKTTIQAIKDANPGISDQLRSDQIIRVPYTGPPARKTVAQEAPKVPKPSAGAPAAGGTGTSTPGTASVPASAPKSTNPTTSVPAAGAPAANVPTPNGIHKVEPGQTLYSIAVKNGVQMADIRRWNNLASDNVMLGQELIVSESTYQARRPAEVVVTTNNLSDSARSRAAVPEKVVKPVEEPVATRPMTGKKMRQTGLAEVIDTDESTSKFLALHRTAPIGTLVQVRNEFNQQTLWVKVIGRIPNTSVNDDIVIKLSARAFERLSPDTRRFRAEISYIEANQ
jgi:LysM repeat protein